MRVIYVKEDEAKVNFSAKKKSTLSISIKLANCYAILDTPSALSAFMYSAVEIRPTESAGL